jgi:hypothetical protein
VAVTIATKDELKVAIGGIQLAVGCFLGIDDACDLEVAALRFREPRACRLGSGLEMLGNGVCDMRHGWPPYLSISDGFSVMLVDATFK